ncbi:hypothetical protein [Flavobacterium ginsengiterrae]|uniref:Uncharacterized protein n=1 Tax=Flavobacterium ginsengiterrae TaxID=871695 RepID=A0ABP7GQ96_9FLAO
MNKTIKIPYTENIDQIYKFGLEQSKQFNGKFSGNTSSGLFDFQSPIGRFSGSYQVTKNTIDIIFSKKPFFISFSLIESFLKSYIK